MVTATDCWSASVLGFSTTAPWAERLARAAATANVTFFRLGMGCCLLCPPLNGGLPQKGYAGPPCFLSAAQHQRQGAQHQRRAGEHRRGDRLVEEQPAPQ